MKISSIVPLGTTQVRISAVLCWSEYYNGKWQPTKTSDVNRPIYVQTVSLSEALDLSWWYLQLFEKDGTLRVIVQGAPDVSFRLNNTHSLPVRILDETDAERLSWYNYLRPTRPVDLRSLSWDQKGNDLEPFSSLYYRGYRHNSSGRPYDSKFGHTVLESPNRFRWIEPCNTPLGLKRPFEAPFFFSDSGHVFFVTTTELPVMIPVYIGYYIELNLYTGIVVKLPDLVLKPDPRKKVVSTFWGDGGPIGPDPGVIDPAPMERFVTEDVYIHQGIGTSGSVEYGGRQIGPSGAIADARAKMNR